MITRRKFIKSAGGATGLAMVGAVMPTAMLTAAETRREILPAGTDPLSLANRDPSRVDARNLAVSSPEQFGTMGAVKGTYDPASWRLMVSLGEGREREYTRSGLLARDSFEKKALLICPGFFSFTAVWKGFSLKDLLAEAGPLDDIAEIQVSGGIERRPKRVTFSRQEVLEEKIFLAHGVNGAELPERHGFPLRIIAPDRYGMDWVKFVFEIKSV